jgi:hypothetical protein
MITMDHIAWIKDGVAVLYLPHPCASSGYRAVVDGHPRLLGSDWVVTLRDMKPFGGLDHRSRVSAARVDYLFPAGESSEVSLADQGKDTAGVSADSDGCRCSGCVMCWRSKTQNSCSWVVGPGQVRCERCVAPLTEDLLSRSEDRANRLDARARELEGMLYKQKEVEDDLRKELRRREGSSRESMLADKCGTLETENKDLLAENARLRRKLGNGGSAGKS